MKNLIYFILILTFLGGCTSEIYFPEPQPKGIEKAISFPKTIQGIYSIEEDTIEVNEKYYTITEVESGHLLMDELSFESGNYIEDNQLHLEKATANSKIDYTISDDTIAYEIRTPEAIYLSDSMVFKSYQGFHFLNIKEDKGWLVYIVELEHDSILTIAFLYGDEMADRLKKFTKVKTIYKNDSELVDYYMANPSKKKFMKFILREDFEDGINYFKQKNN